MPVIDITHLPEKEIVDGYFARAVHTGSMSFVYWRVNAGDALPLHAHHHEQVAQVLKGKFELQVDNEIHVLEPGMIVVIPPNTPHGGRAIIDCELLDVFHPERDDYKF